MFYFGIICVLCMCTLNTKNEMEYLKNYFVRNAVTMGGQCVLNGAWSTKTNIIMGRSRSD